MSESHFPMEGACACGLLRYRVNRSPIFVHACHCSICQCETGSAFALNALVETENVEILQGKTTSKVLPTPSGAGQEMVRCEECGVTTWSFYTGLGAALAFVRVGTLEHPRKVPPDIHIYTSSMHEWMNPSDDTPASEAYYSAKEMMPAESLERMKALC